MCAWDMSYDNSAYPKEIIDPQVMAYAEKAFYDRLVATLDGRVDIDDLAVEQRNGDYRTVVYRSWDNDFLRYHFGYDGFWVSVRMSPALMKSYRDSPLFSAQTNKRQYHWRSSVKPDEIDKIGNVIAESAIFFLAALDGGGNSKASDKTPTSKPAKKPQLGLKALPKTAVRDLEAAWASSGGDKSQLKAELAGAGYRPYYSREMSLAGTRYYEAAGKLRGGEVLICKSEADNPYDNTAVALFDIGGSRVGYLCRSRTKLEAFEALRDGYGIIAIVTHRGIKAGSKSDRTRIMLITAI